MKRRFTTLVIALGAGALLAACMPMHHHGGGDCPGPQHRRCCQCQQCAGQQPPAEKHCDKPCPAEKPQQ